LDIDQNNIHTGSGFTTARLAVARRRLPSYTDDSNGAALTEHKVTLQLQFGERLDLLKIMGTQVRPCRIDACILIVCPIRSTALEATCSRDYHLE
jgi:hypothetical protein